MEKISSLIPGDFKNGIVSKRSGEVSSRIRERTLPPIPSAPDFEIVGTLVQEISKQSGLSGFEPPTEDILIARAESMAIELPEIPHEWFNRVFSVARREYAPEPKIFHLLKAWREVVRDEYQRAKAAKRPKVPPPPPVSEEEREKGFREMWLLCIAKGISISKEIRDKYNFSKEEIEEAKKKTLAD